jgi:hypothetical protein
MGKFFSSLSLFLLIWVTAYAQRADSLYVGTILDQNNAPISYAAIALKRPDGRVIATAVSRQEGVFTFSGIVADKYTIEISCLGYKPIITEIEIALGKYNIGTFHLQEEVMMIDEVVVTARRSLISNQVDRLVYDVEKDPDARNMKTIQLLENIPFVRLNKQSGSLTVFGSDNYVITVNGKKSLYLSEANQYVANLLSGGNLKEIELITTPQGKYTDQIAVINIITKKELPDGIIGVIDVKLADDPLIFNGQTELTSKFGKLTFNLGYDGRVENSQRMQDSIYSINYLSEQKRSNILLQEREAKIRSHSGFLSGSYDFSEYDLLTFSVNINASAQENRSDAIVSYFDSNNNLSDNYNYNSLSKINTNTVLGMTNYQKTWKERPERILTATYRFEDNHADNRYDLLYNIGGESSGTKMRIREHTAAIDFFDRINSKHAYFMTGKYINRHYASDDKLSLTSDYVRNLDYWQQIWSVRGSYSFRTLKLMFSADLNLEYTDNNISFGEGLPDLRMHYLYLMPKLNVSYRISSNSTLTLNYDVPSYRPDIQLLNPFVNDSDPTHLYTGNPYLKPERSHILTSTYRLSKSKISFFVRGQYKYSGNAVYDYDYTTAAGELVTTYGNIGKTNAFSVSTEITYDVTDALEIWGTFEAKRTHYVLGKQEDFSLWHYSANWTLDWNFWNNFYMMGLVWIDPVSLSVQSVKDNYYVGSSLRIGYYSADKLHIFVDCQNFYARYLYNDYEKRTSDFYYFKHEQRTGRLISLGVTFYFGRLDKRVKKGIREVVNTDRSKEY